VQKLDALEVATSFAFWRIEILSGIISFASKPPFNGFLVGRGGFSPLLLILAFEEKKCS